MLLVTADVFSGRPNPSWAITDEQEARAILKEIARSRDVITDAAPPEAGSRPGGGWRFVLSGKGGGTGTGGRIGLWKNHHRPDVDRAGESDQRRDPVQGAERWH